MYEQQGDDLGLADLGKCSIPQMTPKLVIIPHLTIIIMDSGPAHRILKILKEGALITFYIDTCRLSEMYHCKT